MLKQGSTDFRITQTVHSFSGISEAVEASSKTAVSFTMHNNMLENIIGGAAFSLNNIKAQIKEGTAVEVPASDVQLTITEVPSENDAQSCLLSAGEEALQAILSTTEGNYQLTIAVLGINQTYIGTSQWQFTIKG